MEYAGVLQHHPVVGGDVPGRGALGFTVVIPSEFRRFPDIRDQTHAPFGSPADIGPDAPALDKDGHHPVQTGEPDQPLALEVLDDQTAFPGLKNEAPL